MPSYAGKSTRKMAERRRKDGIRWLIVAFLIILALYFLLENATALGLGSGAIIVLLILMVVIRDLAESYDRRQTKAERRAVRGAIAEERVGDILAGLGEGYLVLHDIVSPYGNIDHVVISRHAGIFLLETKAHGGKVTRTETGILVNGHAPEKDFIAQALKNAYWLRDQVGAVLGKKPWIIPVVVFTNAFVDAGRPIKGVYVINGRYLPRFLQRPSKPRAENEILWAKRNEVTRIL